MSELEENSVDPDEVSPNYIADLAAEHGIELTSEEIVALSNELEEPNK